MQRQQDSLGALLVDITRMMRRVFQQRMEGSGITLAQARVLVYVARHEGLRQIELADMLEVQPITLARLVDQLVEAGLVERRMDPDDRRAYRIHVTAAAGPPLAAIEQVMATIRAQAMHGLDRKQAQALLDGLRLMRNNLTGL
jgi:DNA-binding MarR family transcriptional regulator